MSIRAIVVDNSEELLEKITRILREMEDVELCGSFGEAPCCLIDAAALLDAASRKLREDMHYFVSRIPDPA